MDQVLKTEMYNRSIESKTYRSLDPENSNIDGVGVGDRADPKTALPEALGSRHAIQSLPMKPKPSLSATDARNRGQPTKSRFRLSES